MAAQLYIEIKEVEHVLVQATILLADGSPANLTAATIDFLVKDSAGTTIFTASIGSGVTIINAPAGRADILVPPPVEPGLYRYECMVTLSSGVVGVPFEGYLRSLSSIHA